MSVNPLMLTHWLCKGIMEGPSLAVCVHSTRSAMAALLSPTSVEDIALPVGCWYWLKCLVNDHLQSLGPEFFFPRSPADEVYHLTLNWCTVNSWCSIITWSKILHSLHLSQVANFGTCLHANFKCGDSWWHVAKLSELCLWDLLCVLSNKRSSQMCGDEESEICLTADIDDLRTVWVKLWY